MRYSFCSLGVYSLRGVRLFYYEFYFVFVDRDIAGIYRFLFGSGWVVRGEEVVFDGIIF